MVIAVDFDGTCVTHEFPKIGKDIGAIPVLRKLVEKEHQIILYTMRSHCDNKCVTNEGVRLVDTLYEAIDWFRKNEIPLYGVIENPTQHNWTSSKKIFAHIYIDDSALGIPLKHDEYSTLPYVDWNGVEILLKMRGIL